MRCAVALFLLAACGGPSQRQLAETPSATTRARPAEAPAASSSDKDRERSVQQFDDMQTTQNAYHEAQGENPPPPTSVTQPPTKTGPGEQAPSQPKKKGPAEQAPPQPR